MKIEVKNKYSNADIYAQPVCDPIPKEKFIKYLREGVDDIFSGKEIQLDVNCSYINILESYLNKYGIESVIPGEEFFAELWDRMMKDGDYCGKNYKIHTRKKVARAMRKIVNEYFLPKVITKRRVLLEVEMARYKRFFRLTKTSQDAIRWFEENGKRVKATPFYVKEQNEDIDAIDVNKMEFRIILQVTNQKLLPVTISQKIYAAMRVLDIVGKNGFEEITNDDVKKFLDYCSNSNLKKKDDYKADAATFFMNIKSQRFIKRNPFSDVSLKRNSESMRTDFISKEDIDKLKDLSTVDYEDKTSVRDRLIAILAYDLALRINEFLALKMSDLHKDMDGTWSVTLRSESQKGHKVDDVTYFSFPETSEILERYLAIREKFCPKTDHLFVSKTGDALSQQHCRVRFKELCKKLNIMTYYGNVASPHCLRHSFATLNVEPLGLCMSLHDIAERLRHSRIETTRYHYVHNNPYIKKEKMKRYQKKSKKKTHMEILDETPLPELEHWLSDRVKVEPHIINIIRSKYKKAFVKPIDNAPKDVIYLSEVEALDRIKHLSISAYALRKYGLKKGICLVEGKGDIRYGRNFRYTESFIDDLANNWVPAKELVAKFKISRSDFYRRLKKNGWRKAKIGKACYIYKADCV